jgi:endoglucanase
MGQALDFPHIQASEYGEFFLGKGPGISRGANTNPTVFRILTEVATSRDIPFQVNATPSTSPTDPRVLQIAKRGIAAGLLEVPLRYMHTPSEVVNLKDIENCARLMAGYCRAVGSDVDFRPR